MGPISPVMPGSRPIEVLLGEGQPEYVPLPAVYLNAESLPMVTRWSLTEAERAAIAAGADVVLTQLTFGFRFQPVHLQIVFRDAMPVLVT
jgi:hypothetical protein